MSAKELCTVTLNKETTPAPTSSQLRSGNCAGYFSYVIAGRLIAAFCEGPWVLLIASEMGGKDSMSEQATEPLVDAINKAGMRRSGQRRSRSGQVTNGHCPFSKDSNSHLQQHTDSVASFISGAADLALLSPRST